MSLLKSTVPTCREQILLAQGVWHLCKERCLQPAQHTWHRRGCHAAPQLTDVHPEGCSEVPAPHTHPTVRAGMLGHLPWRAHQPVASAGCSAQLLRTPGIRKLGATKTDKQSIWRVTARNVHILLVFNLPTAQNTNQALKEFPGVKYCS